MKPLVYVAGAYSADDLEQVELNVAKALDAGDRLEDSGLVFAVIPHLSHFRHGRKPRDYEHWMAADFALLARCDALLRMPGPSRGADREVAKATALCLPVFWTEAEALSWAGCPGCVKRWPYDGGGADGFGWHLEPGTTTCHRCTRRIP